MPADGGVAVAGVVRMRREHVEREGEDLAVPGVLLGLGVARVLRRRYHLDEAIGFVADHLRRELSLARGEIVPKQPGGLASAGGPEGGLPLVLPLRVSG